EWTKPSKLLRSKTERGTNLIDAFEDSVISRGINPIWPRPELEKTVDHGIRKSRKRAQDVSWRPGHVNGSGAVEGELLVPARRRSKSLPPFHLFQFVDSDQQRIGRLVAFARFRSIQSHEIIRVHPVE